MKQFLPFSLNINGDLKTFEMPAIMGIINVTENSFYAESRVNSFESICKRAEGMVADGADIIDIGGCSTKQGAEEVSEETEIKNILLGIEAIRSVSSDIIISVDTFRSEVARAAIKAGANIINDISGGDLDSKMFDTVAELHVPYILMHCRGNSATMMSLTDYGIRGVVATVLDDLGFKLNTLALKGVNDIIIDPGFGFAKDLNQNYLLLRELEVFKVLQCPVLVGMSRKSMAKKLLGISAEESLEATVALNSFALDRGASILRVHDVKAAKQAVRIFMAINQAKQDYYNA